MIDAFDNVPRAFVHMFVLLTIENYPEITQGKCWHLMTF